MVPRNYTSRGAGAEPEAIPMFFAMPEVAGISHRPLGAKDAQICLSAVKDSVGLGFFF